MPWGFKQLGGGEIPRACKRVGWNINRDRCSQDVEKEVDSVCGDHAQLIMGVYGDVEVICVCE